MKRILPFVLLAFNAHASERLLGSMLISAGISNNNAITLSPFVIPQGSKVSVQCNIDTFVLTDAQVSSATLGVKIPADSVLYTSVGFIYSQVILTQKSGMIALFSASSGVCNVFMELGNEFRKSSRFRR